MSWKCLCHIILCAEQKWYFARRCPFRRRIRYGASVWTLYYIFYDVPFPHIISYILNGPSILLTAAVVVVRARDVWSVAVMGALYRSVSAVTVCFFLAPHICVSVVVFFVCSVRSAAIQRLVFSILILSGRTLPATQWGNIFFLRL